MFELKVKTRFAGAHQLAMVGQKCENLHGHNWHVEVCVKGEKLNDAGVLADFGDIKRAVRAVVDGELDHKFLNELPAFEGEQRLRWKTGLFKTHPSRNLFNPIHHSTKRSV